MTPRTLFEKVWESHLVMAETQEHPAVLYVDLHLIHEVTSPQAFRQLRERRLAVRRPERTIATMDHSTPTLPPAPDGTRPFAGEAARKQVALLEENCAEFGIELLGWDNPGRGIVHVIAPEMGLSRPGMTIVCGDSHTSTHGAFGALAFGIGTTEVGHVLATQSLLQRKPKSMAVTVDGALSPGVTAKDVILGIIAEIGTGGGTGHVIEYRGAAIRSLSMEGRMTVCNMSIEAGARAGMIAPDETTFAWIRGRERAPQGCDFDSALEHWRQLCSDEAAHFESAVTFDANALRPMITYGTNPGMAVAVDAPVPEADDPDSRKALNYMRLEPGRPLAGTPVDVVFIGSCTNARLSDLEQAAEILRARQIDPRVRLLVVPGSQKVKTEAEALGLHEVFMAAGGQWREAGCSMCIAMNGDMAAPGELAVSTSNRNFEGRQGKGARTILASPLTAAASALAGAVADPRPYIEGRTHA